MKYQDNMSTNNELCQILQEKGTRNLEQDIIGTGNKELGTRYDRNREQGKGTRNKIYYEQGTRNLEQDIIGTGKKEQGIRKKIFQEQGTWNKELETKY